MSRSGKSSPSLSEKAKLSARENDSKLRKHAEVLAEVDEYGNIIEEEKRPRPDKKEDMTFEEYEECLEEENDKHELSEHNLAVI